MMITKPVTPRVWSVSPFTDLYQTSLLGQNKVAGETEISIL